MDKPRLKVQVTHAGQVKQEGVFLEFPVIFGRSPDCKLRLKEWDYISRIHGSIALNKDEIIVTDLGSSHGLLAEGKRVQSVRGLKSIKFSVHNLHFSLSLEGREDLDENSKTLKVFHPELLPENEVPRGIGFSLEPVPGISTTPVKDLAFQGVITWGDSIYDIRNFQKGDRLVIGPHLIEPIYLPIANHIMDMGYFSPQGAVVKVNPQGKWGLYRDKKLISFSQLTEERKIIAGPPTFKMVIIKLNEVISMDLGFNLSLHFRYVRKPEYVVPRTLMENRDEIRKAVITSGFIHSVMCLLAFFAVPKYEIKQIENVPPRIAKLIFEPPSQILAPPPKLESLPEPKPESKPEPPKPKAEQIKPRPLRKEVVKKQPVEIFRNTIKSNPKTQVREDEDLPTQEKEAVTQEEVADILKALPGTQGAPKAGTTIQIRKEQTSLQGVKVGGVTALQNIKSSKSEISSGEVFKVGSSGYSKSGVGSRTGKRGVVGQVVGAPEFSPKVGGIQGLNEAEVMRVVNRYLGDAQRCYERALFEDPSLKGKVEYEWEISSNGSVTRASVYRSEIARADTLNNCIISLFRKMKFPVAKNGLSTVAKIGFPFGKN